MFDTTCSYQSTFSQIHKIGNIGINANFVFPYISSFLHNLQNLMLVNMKFLPPTNGVWEKVSVILFTGGLPHFMLGYTPLNGTRGRHPPGATGRHPPHPWNQRQTPPPAVHAGRYGQQAGGKHPTKMQSCYMTRSHFNIVDFIDLVNFE